MAIILWILLAIVSWLLALVLMAWSEGGRTSGVGLVVFLVASTHVTAYLMELSIETMAAIDGITLLILAVGSYLYRKRRRHDGLA